MTWFVVVSLGAWPQLSAMFLFGFQSQCSSHTHTRFTARNMIDSMFYTEGEVKRLMDTLKLGSELRLVDIYK